LAGGAKATAASTNEFANTARRRQVEKFALFPDLSAFSALSFLAYIFLLFLPSNILNQSGRRRWCRPKTKINK